MLDVIFLLLTFFIYAFVVMVQAKVMPLQLTPLTTGAAAEAGGIHAITVDRAGLLYWDRQAIDGAELDAKLAAAAALDPQPKVLLAVEDAPPTEGASTAATDPAAAGPVDAAVVDRGPVLVELLQRVRAAGVKDFALVGRSQE